MISRDSGRTVARRDEGRQAKAGASVGQRLAVERRHGAARRRHQGVARGRIPFRDRCHAHIEIRRSFGEPAEFDRCAADLALHVCDAVEIGVGLRLAMKPAHQRNGAAQRPRPGPDRGAFARRRGLGSGRKPQPLGTLADHADPQCAERRRRDHAGDRAAAVHQCDVDGVFGLAGDEFAGAVERIDQQESPAGRRRHVTPGSFLGNHRNSGKKPAGGHRE